MIGSRLVDSEVWFVTGSQSMYGPDTLEQVAVQSQEIAALLDSSPEIPVRVRWQPTVVSAEAIAAVVADANRDPHCIGIVAWMHTFSPPRCGFVG